VDEGFEVVGVEVGEFSADFEAVSVLWGADEVHVDVSDDGHVSGSVAGAQPGEIIVEDDVADPREVVFDAPMGAHRQGENIGGRLWRRTDSIAAREPSRRFARRGY
jgi:hypothetical protein